MKVYNKIVRDNIPQIIEAKCKIAKFRVLSDVEYRTFLGMKLHEEFLEFTHSNEQEQQFEELADIVGLVYGILESKGVSIENFEKVRLAKKDLRVGFKEKLFLLSVEE